MMSFGISKILLCVEIIFNSSILIRKNFPYFGADNIQSHRRLKIWLIKLCKYPVGKVRLKLSIKILFGINIDKAAASTSIIVILVSVLNSNMVFT